MNGLLLLTSPSNPRVKEIAKLCQRSHRDRAGALLVEEYRELKRVVDNAWRPRTLVTCPELFLGKYEPALIARCVEAGQLPEFFDNLLGICKELHPSKQGQGEYDNRCSKDPAIVRNADGSITVDLTKCKSPEVAMALLPVVGAQSFALPEVIDQETYDKLVELDEDPTKKEAFVQSLAPRLSPEALAATRTRLDEAISHARALKKKNKVIAADDWSNPDTVRNLAKLRNSVTLPSTQGQGIHKASRDSRHVSNFLVRICPSYFRRDYMGDSIPW